MAVNTTVEVVMPPMGDSVSEGSVLEWHKQEGDEVAEDETLVEISTDKVDAEVPAPVSGTVVKIHAAEGDTVGIGAVLAEIAPTNGSAPGSVDEEAAEEQVVDITMPAMGESVSEGTILEWAKQPGDHVEADETIVEISTDKVDAEVPAPGAGTITELLADAGDTVTVGQVIARMTTATNGASATAPAEPAPAEPADRDGADGAKYVLGWCHGIGWIVMSLLSIAAVRTRTIPLWLGVMVAVVGGVGPFAGTIGFLVEERRAKVAAGRAERGMV